MRLHCGAGDPAFARRPEIDDAGRAVAAARLTRRGEAAAEHGMLEHFAGYEPPDDEAMAAAVLDGVDFLDTCGGQREYHGQHRQRAGHPANSEQPSRRVRPPPDQQKCHRRDGQGQLHGFVVRQRRRDREQDDDGYHGQSPDAAGHERCRDEQPRPDQREQHRHALVGFMALQLDHPTPLDDGAEFRTRATEHRHQKAPYRQIPAGIDERNDTGDADRKDERPADGPSGARIDSAHRGPRDQRDREENAQTHPGCEAFGAAG